MVRYLARGLAARGHGVTVLTQAPAATGPGEVTIDGVRVLRLGNWGNWPHPMPALAFWVECAAWIMKHRQSLSVVHAHQLYAAMGSCFTRWAHGVPVIVHLHGGSIRGHTDARVSELADLHNRFLGRLRARVIFDAADVVLAASPDLAREVHEKYPDTPVCCFPNGVDGNHFRPPTPRERDEARHRLGLTENPCALYVGRLTRTKGADRLLSLWPGAGPQLVVCGSGELEGEFKLAATNTQGLFYAGAVNDVRPYMWAADFVVLPSRYEGLPLSLLEAMACGLPAVAADVGAISQAVVDEQTGFLVPSCNESFVPEGPFVAAVRSLASDDGARSRLSVQARKRFSEHFDLSVVITRLVDWYRYVSRPGDL